MGGKILASRWKHEDLDKRCFEWMNNRRTALTCIITGVQDLYKQLLPTKLYTGKKIKTTNHQDYTAVCVARAKRVLRTCWRRAVVPSLKLNIICNASLMTMEYVQIRVNCRGTLGMLAGMMNP